MCCAEFASSAQLGVVMVVAITSGVSLICTILLWRSQKVARDTAACFDRIEAVGFKRSANALPACLYTSVAGIVQHEELRLTL